MAQPQSSPSTSAVTTTTVSSGSRTAVSKTPASESPQLAHTFVNWDGERHLHVYMIDYCRKRGFRASVEALSNETKIPHDEPVPTDAPQGLLFEWWVVFWEISSARREQSVGGQATDAANAYVHAERKKAELQQQQLHEAQMRANVQQQAQPLWTPQGPPGEYGRQLLPGATRPGYPTAPQIHGIPPNPAMHGQYPLRINGVGPGGANPQMQQQVRSYGQTGQLNPALGLATPQNTGAPQHGQPSQMAQMNIANVHKFAPNGLNMHAPGTQAPPQQPQQPGAQPHPAPNYQQSPVNRGIFSGPSPQISHANPSPPQNNPNSTLPQHPQPPVQQSSHSYYGMNVNTGPGSLQNNFIRQTGQTQQQQQQSQQPSQHSSQHHPQSYGTAQTREPPPRPSSRQISTNHPLPAASHPHSASSTPAPNQQHAANGQGQPSPNRDVIASRPQSQPQSQNAQQGVYPVQGQYGSGPGGVFTNQPGVGPQGTMGTLGLAVKKDQGEGGPEIDGQGQSGPQTKAAASTRPLGRPGSGAPVPFMTPTAGPNAPSAPHQPQPQTPGGSLPPGHVQAGTKRPGSPISQYGPDRNQDASTPDQNKRPRRSSVSSDRPTNNPPSNPGQATSNPPALGYSSYSAYGTQNRTPIAYTQPRPGLPMQQMNPAQRISSAPAPANSSFVRPALPLQNQALNHQNPSHPQQGPPPPPQASQQQQPTPQQPTPTNAMLGGDPNRQGSVQTLNTDAQAQVATLNRPGAKPRISALNLGAGRGTFIPSSPSMASTVVASKGMMPPPQTPGTTAAAPGAPKEKGKEKEESMSSNLSEAQNDLSTTIMPSPRIKNTDGTQKPSTPAPSSTTFSHPSISPVANASNPPTSTVSVTTDSSKPSTVTAQFPYSNPISQPSGPAPLSFTDELSFGYLGDYSDFGSNDLFDDFLNLGTENGGDIDDVGVVS